MRGADDAEDLVVWMLRAIVDEMPGLPSNTVLRLEQLTRVHWGGRRPYIAKHGPSPLRPTRKRPADVAT